MMDKDAIVEQTINYVKTELQHAEGGHDWWHIERVYKNALHIAASEDVNIFIVQLASLLHDIADAKFYNGDENIGPGKAKQFLMGLHVDEETIDHVVNIIKNISFKGGNFKGNFFSKELAVVQDADRLDAIGAIGIARAFNYGGFTNRQLYNPGVKPDMLLSKEAYKKSNAPTINHFYEKLLLLTERMNTTSGKKIAGERHLFMERFLDEFYAEWNGDK